MGPISKVNKNPGGSRIVDNKDLLHRTQGFSERMIELSIKIPHNSTNNILIGQGVRSVTSVGANYREACEAESAKDFVHKIRLSKKESRESHYWLMLLVKANPAFTSEINFLLKESEEFVKIFSSISHKFREK